MKKIYTILAVNIILMLLFSVKAQIPNSGFEDWAIDGSDNNPVSWSTSNSSPYVSVTPYTPAYSGNYSMKVSAFDAGMMVINGTAGIDFPLTKRPKGIKACIKTTVMPGDKVFLILTLYKDDFVIASPTNCSFTIDSTISNFTCLSFPITYISNLVPDFANITIIAGSAPAQSGTEIIVDELSFGY